MAQSDGSLIFDTKIDKKGFESGAASLKSFATKSAVAIGAIFAAGIGGAVKTGMDFKAGMSEVQAISRASTKDIELLNDKAKEMGAVTKFSASESVAAFKYMAQAGWDTEDMLFGIDGVMSLAAASGEDLALTSDIVTDSLTAFGLKASDAAHFSDVLAMAANASNTGVALMGETFKYVAPIAGALGYSVEDMSVAIGLMANNGIKGSQAGTALRATLTRLAKPTEESRVAMQELGVSLTDTQGNMKPFSAIMQDMRQGFSKLTKDQKASYAAMLGGQEAMSGLLAIVNSGDSDFNNLTNQINNAGGAAGEAAKIMQNNLAGELEQLGGSAETLGLNIFNGIETPLKNAVNAGTEKINELSDSFQNGELKPAIDNVGKLLGNITDSTIDFATGAIPLLVSGLSAISMNLNFILPIAGMATAGVLAYKTTVGAAALAQTAWNTAVSLSPIGLTVAAIAAAGVGIYTIASACREAEEAYYNFGDEIETVGLKFDETKEKATLTDDKATQWYALKDAIASGKLPADELAAAEQKVKDTEQWFIDNYGIFISAEEQKNGIRAQTVGLVQDQAKALSETQQLELENQLLQDKSNVPDMIEEINKLEEKNKKLEEQRKTALENSIALTNMKNEYQDFLNTNPSDSELNEYLAEMSTAVENLTGTGLSGAGFADLDQRILDFSKNAENAAGTIEDNNQKMADGKESLQQYADGAKRIIELHLGSSYEDASKNLGILKSAQDEFNNSGGISKEKLDNLVKTFPDLANAKDNPELITQKMQELEQKIQDAQNKAKDLGTDLSGLPTNLDINVNLKVNGADNIPHNAKGTNYAKRGLSVVNERGLEFIEGIDGSFRYVDSDKSSLTYLNKGDKVYTAQQTKNMLKGKSKKLPGFAGGLNNSGTGLGFAASISGNIGASSYEVGKMIDLGIASGIDDYSGEVIASAVDLGDAVIGATKKYNDELSRITAERNAADEEANRQSYEEKLAKAEKSAEREKLIAEEEARLKKKSDNEYLEGLKAEAEKEKKIREQKYDTLKNSLSLGLISTEDYYSRLTDLRDESFVEGSEDWEKYTLEIVKGYRDKSFKDLKYSLDMGYITEEQYYKDLEGLRDEYFTKGSDDWNSYTLGILNYQKSRIKEAYEDIANYADNSIGKVTDAQKAMQSKLNSFGGLTQTVKMNMDGKTLEWEELADLESQNKALEDYVNSMETLKGKFSDMGADDNTIKNIMAEIEGMSIGDANKTLRAFNNAPNLKLKNYASLYSKKLSLSNSLSSSYYKDDLNAAIDESIKYAKDKLTDFGFDVTEDFFTTGSESANEFGSAFSIELGKQLAGIKLKIDGFNADLSYSISQGAGNVNNYNTATYNTTYNLENSGSTVEAGIAAAKRQDTIKRMIKD